MRLYSPCSLFVSAVIGLLAVCNSSPQGVGKGRLAGGCEDAGLVEYYDAVVKKCIPCKEICLNLPGYKEFCYKNCPELYNELFAPKTTTATVLSLSVTPVQAVTPAQSVTNNVVRSDDNSLSRLLVSTGSVPPLSTTSPELSSFYLYVCIGAMIVTIVTLTVLIVLCVITCRRNASSSLSRDASSSSSNTSDSNTERQTKSFEKQTTPLMSTLHENSDVSLDSIKVCPSCHGRPAGCDNQQVTASYNQQATPSYNQQATASYNQQATPSCHGRPAGCDNQQVNQSAVIDVRRDDKNTTDQQLIKTNSTQS